MGAFLVYFTSMQIRFAYWIMFRAGTFEAVAYVALPLWLVEQFFNRWLETNATGVETVAYTAHIGGFAFGFAAGMAAKLFWPPPPEERAPDLGLDPVPRAVAQRVPKKIGKPELERYQQCMAAVGRRDVAAVRTSASRVILDLARAKDHRRMLDLYDTITANLSTVKLTDGAYAALTVAADAEGHHEQYVAIANALSREHPYSTQVPKVLWRLAQIHRDMGNSELATATFRDLAKRFPRDELGRKAAAEVKV
jgi:hypothetical protein